MIPCPNCHQSVEILDKHLGTLYTCPHCNAVYFIDWNGQPEMAQHEPEPEPVEAPVEQNYQEQNFQDQSGYPEQSYQGQDYQAQEYQQPEVPNEQEPAAFDGGFNEAPNMAYESPAETSFEAISEDQEVHGEVPAVEEAPYDFSQTLDSVGSPLTPEPLAPAGVSDTADFSDVTDFANADTVSGPLAYTLTIEGIESSLLVSQLREAMTDSRFGWDVATILSQIGGGRLVIKGLSPAKASVLINRIKYLPFKISWRQDVLSGS
ncbi:zf-TFIIB domain-containing protein [Bdellovibrio sp.]|uniref:TFIIB-type zinc ribbon-containing protein n=1 Tax=Bdellovibrio sp. TaxID=28201 RepID=UPI0032213FF7